ncbi:hypothetical protein [Burkholderia sp. WSM2232]|uniref:hypothetical protein n=1 Tax=Burkholderia sp. WSM2232 TaxID=944436 RepID=UPI00040D21C5|nr:hypothetical protein [Burkholderia sp. WSM2232]
MNTADRKNFDALTSQLLSSHAGFSYAVSRIAQPSESAVRTAQSATVAMREIDSRQKQANVIEAFCAG